MKYNALLGEPQRLLPQAQNILIALPLNPSLDHLAAGLSLYLSLNQVNRPVAIVSDGPVLVGHTNLFGVGQIQNKLPQTSGGNYILTLVGVASPNDPDKPVPSVEKMDYKTEGADLKLVFNVVPGQRFEPQAVVPSYSGGSFDLIFVIGSPTLNGLGSIYSSNSNRFNAHVVNIDNQNGNTSYGSTNVIDPAASSLSEMVAQLLPGLALPFEGDIASNILNGIYAATANLQGANVGADTFLIIAEALRAGGQKPVGQNVAPPVGSMQPVGQTDQYKAWAEAFTPISSSGGEKSSESQPTPQPSPEERPIEEGITSEGEIVNPEPDWLTPKIFKGGSVG